MQPTYEMKEFDFLMSNKKLKSVEHDNYQTELFVIDNIVKQNMIVEMSEYVIGVRTRLDIWSDYDLEEPSTDCYIAVKKATGAMYHEFIEDLDSLIKYIHDDTYDIYRLRVEDNLI